MGFWYSQYLWSCPTLLNGWFVSGCVLLDMILNMHHHPELLTSFSNSLASHLLTDTNQVRGKYWPLFGQSSWPLWTCSLSNVTSIILSSLRVRMSSPGSLTSDLKVYNSLVNEIHSWIAFRDLLSLLYCEHWIPALQSLQHLMICLAVLLDGGWNLLHQCFQVTPVCSCLGYS